MANNVDSDDQLDPRIKGELEALNSSAESINKLENEIQKARSLFKKHKTEYANNLQALSRKIGIKVLTQARVFFDAMKHLNKLQSEAEKAANRFQKASSLYKTAQETVSLAEQQLTSEDGSKLAFDTAWQEMLNHANLRFMDAEKEKRMSEEEYETCSKKCLSLQMRINVMKKEMMKAIDKSRPFYEMKQNFEKKLQIEKQNAEDLQLALICSKQKYKLALANLEQISEDIHMQRNDSKLPRRTPGVGAESDACSELSDIFSTNLDFISDSGSQISKDDFASDIYFDETLVQDDRNEASPFDNFFDRMSKKFQRSSSMGNLNFKFEVPQKASNDFCLNPTSRTDIKDNNRDDNRDDNRDNNRDDNRDNNKDNNKDNNRDNNKDNNRDDTLEGAEDMHEKNEKRPSKLFTSTTFLPISYPIEKARMEEKQMKESYNHHHHHHFVDPFHANLQHLNDRHIPQMNKSEVKTQHPTDQKVDKNSLSYPASSFRKESF